MQRAERKEQRVWTLCAMRYALCFFLLPALSPLLYAASTHTLTLDEVLELARKNNPEILAAKKRWDGLRAKITAEKTLEKPRFSYEKMYSGDEKLIGVSQEFPFPGKLYLKGQVALKEALMTEQSYRAKEREILARTKSAYAKYFLALKSIKIFEENIELMRHFSKVAESKYTIGKVNQVDVLRAQIELSKMLNMLVTLQQEKESAQAMLNALLNQPPENSLGNPQEPMIKKRDLSFDKLQNTAISNRPELLQAQHHQHHSKIMLRSAQLEYLPDIMAEYRQRSAMNPAMDNTQDVMIGFTIPLWFWKQKAMVQMAKSEKEMADAEYQATTNMTLFNVKDLQVKVQTAERLVDLYQSSVIPQAENALKVTETAYQSDKANFLELIDIQRSLLQFRLEYYQYLTEYEQWLAELERTLGKEL